MKKQVLYRFFSGKTSDEETRQLLDWMDESDENKKEFFRERKLYDAILLSDGAVFEDSSDGRMKMISYIRKLLRLAAVFLFAVLLSYFYFNRNKQSEPVVTMNTITVPAGQHVNLTLGDGTDIWLNARSVLRYPTTFASDQRRIQLDGEAFFDVSKDKQKPFIVETKKYKIEVLGTQFNLLAYSEKELFETALLEGSIKLESKTDIDRMLTLNSGEMAFEKEGTLNTSMITDYDHFRWKEGLICFKNQPFDHIIYEFEKTYGTKIIVENKKVLKHSYSGKFRQSDGIGHALRVLQLSINFQFQRDDENNIIYIK